MATDRADIAIWVVTPGGLDLARRLKQKWPTAVVRCSAGLSVAAGPDAEPFERLQGAVERHFTQTRKHLFIMAAGIVVRVIAPLLKNKRVDPAVVVVDDMGRFAISLVSGHIGGANRLAGETAQCLGAAPVITTATDLHHKPAADVVAVERGLVIENPAAIKAVNMALLMDKPFYLHDPWRAITDAFPMARPVDDLAALADTSAAVPGIYVGEIRADLPRDVLILRPPVLTAGVGCNRNTREREILDLLRQVLARRRLALTSLRALASIDLKAGEPGLIRAAQTLGLPLLCYAGADLARIDGIVSPSSTVQKHVGVSSVCEAAAILAGGRGPLIVAKHKSANATVAIARVNSLSWASAPADLTICPNAPDKR